LVAVADAGGCQHWDLATLDRRDLRIQRVPLGAQIGQAPLRIGLGALDDLTQQLDGGVQPRLGGDERGSSQLRV